jgi:serine/threonine-protein kinase
MARVADRSGVGSELAQQTATLAARRYHKLAELARGGSGRIVAARDLAFDRSVAIKEPLEPARDGHRLRAEAEILARLQHPSIVPVYDTGVWSDGVPFFAMKLVEGRSLRHMILDAPGLEQRLALIPHLIAVADAIAYAHAQGIIHRDLKPGNVLIGAFGETIVIDWGLAKRVHTYAAPDTGDPGLGPRREPMASETVTGAVLGTPAYMAPEQARGERLDERTDVYALGAMLYQLLTGDAPFSDAPGGDIIAAVGAAAPTRIDEVQPRAPADLVAIATKAMARAPAGRYPTAAELADDLRRFQTGRLVTARRYSPFARLRRWLRKRRGVVLGVGIACASATVAVLAAPSGPPPGAQCARSGDRIRGVWDPDHRLTDRSSAVRAALLASGRPSAEDSFERVAAQLDRYSRDWVATRVDACEATQVRGEQSDALLDLRMACLDQRLDDVDALVRELATPRPGLIDKAVEAAVKLPPLAACADARALQAVVPLPADPVIRSRIEAARQTLATAKALAAAGAYRDGRTVAAAAAGAAEALTYAPLLAEALYWRAELEDRAGDIRAAEATLHRALQVAADGRTDALAARIWASLVTAVGDLARPDEALAMTAASEAAVRRAGGDPEDEARLWMAVASAYNAKGKFEDARSYLERVIALRQRALGPDHPDVAGALVNMAAVLTALDRGAEALPLQQRALAVFERALGRDHPKVVLTQNNIGAVYFDAGRYAEALQSFQYSLATAQRVFGPDHPEVALTSINRGISLANLGQNDDALRDFERAEVIFAKALGPDHPRVGVALNHACATLIDLGRFDEARRACERSLAITEHALGPDHLEVCGTLLNLGEIALHRRAYDEARRVVVRAETLQRAALGPDHTRLAEAYRAHAEIALAQGRHGEARSLAERAVHMLEATPKRLDLARDSFVLARVLWTSLADRPRARELARAARATYAQLGAQRSRPAIDLAEWLAGHDVN